MAAPTTKNRLLQGTAASQARATISDAQAKALERIRQRREKEQYQLVAAMALELTKRSSNDDENARKQKAVAARRSTFAPTTRRLAGDRPRLTIPMAPKFATTVRHGEPQSRSASTSSVPLARSADLHQKGLREDYRVPVNTTSRSALVSARNKKPTLPISPQFATTLRHGKKDPPPGGTGPATLAQSTDMLCKGLRQQSSLPSRRESHVTIPQTPKFHTSAKRELPKSTEEQEKEMMQYNNSHPFKATPVGTQYHPAPPKGGSKRRATMPAPFTLRTEVRGATAKPPVGSLDPEQDDIAELAKQFHARPMPRFSRPTSLPASESKSHAEDERMNPDDIELSKRFRAKPAPKSTYEYHPPPKSPQPDHSWCSNAPTLATSDRIERRLAAAETFNLHAERLSLLRQHEQRMRKREKHQKEMTRAATTPLAKANKNVEPFALASAVRHEHYQKQLEGKRREEEAKRRHEMTFQARSFNSRPPPQQQKIRSDKGPTQPEPFQMPGMRRHAIQQEEQRRKLAEMEEEQKRQAAFRAKPVPKTTYSYTPIATPLRETQQQLVHPKSPALQSKQRAAERQAFDAAATQERAAQEARKWAAQERLAAEEEEEWRERRRLPVSEGGMIPTAEPVNAVFYK
jgi:hypothetical protein